jgi:hypothetical protein
MNPSWGVCVFFVIFKLECGIKIGILSKTLGLKKNLNILKKRPKIFLKSFKIDSNRGSKKAQKAHLICR